ncbi:MAG: hypothetical protein MHPSP_003392, partial [Paramarteilia canceri]
TSNEETLVSRATILEELDQECDELLSQCKEDKNLLTDYSKNLEVLQNMSSLAARSSGFATLNLSKTSHEDLNLIDLDLNQEISKFFDSQLKEVELSLKISDKYLKSNLKYANELLQSKNSTERASLMNSKCLEISNKAKTLHTKAATLPNSLNLVSRNAQNDSLKLSEQVERIFNFKSANSEQLKMTKNTSGPSAFVSPNESLNREKHVSFK